ncbi:hypothetical protein BP6252_04203 [Coleophoma cylindrospora]|uniref:Uncharacterized protein n=1 Tax=Coleophoma cylindrospora TaxID=1849047 RepID=A0A3D8RZU9_9HELO|nr:hypothetical protein BP6252_04203 [Coleophoma cylindrospora]
MSDSCHSCHKSTREGKCKDSELIDEGKTFLTQGKLWACALDLVSLMADSISVTSTTSRGSSPPAYGFPICDDAADESLLDEIRFKFFQTYEWADLPLSMQIKIISLLSRRINYVATCEMLRLSPDEMIQFAMDYNSQLDNHLAQLDKIEQANRECCELLKQGFASGSDRWKAAWEKEWDPVTMHISAEAAYAGLAFLLRYEPVMTYDKGLDSKDILDEIGKFGVDYQWYEVSVQGPEGFLKSINRQMPENSETPEELPPVVDIPQERARSLEAPLFGVRRRNITNKKG